MWDEDKAKFWVDADGDVHFKGDLTGATGTFSGSLMVGGDTGFRVDAAGNLSIGGTALNPNFFVSSEGTLTARGGTFSGTVDASKLLINGSNALTEDDRIAADFLDLGNIQLDGETGNITLNGNINLSNGVIEWGSNNPAAGAISASTAQTLITSNLVSSPTIKGAEIYGGSYYDIEALGKLELSYKGALPALTFSGRLNTSDPFRDMFLVWGTGNETNISLYGGLAWSCNSSYTDPGETYPIVNYHGKHIFWHDVDLSHANVKLDGVVATFG